MQKPVILAYESVFRLKYRLTISHCVSRLKYCYKKVLQTTQPCIFICKSWKVSFLVKPQWKQHGKTWHIIQTHWNVQTLVLKNNSEPWSQWFTLWLFTSSECRMIDRYLWPKCWTVTWMWKTSGCSRSFVKGLVLWGSCQCWHEL